MIGSVVLPVNFVLLLFVLLTSIFYIKKFVGKVSQFSHFGFRISDFLGPSLTSKLCFSYSFHSPNKIDLSSRIFCSKIVISGLLNLCHTFDTHCIGVERGYLAHFLILEILLVPALQIPTYFSYMVAILRATLFGASRSTMCFSFYEKICLYTGWTKKKTI